ncbi:armadillo-type protein [Chytridium lagenaria]|nr:armadillo-type protein [Chytridium lagenaria]
MPPRDDDSESDMDDYDHPPPNLSEEDLSNALTASDLDVPWPQFLITTLAPTLLETSLTRRVAVFHGASLKVRQGGLPDEKTLRGVVIIMVKTLTRFHDNARKAVMTLLVELCKKARSEGDGTVDHAVMKVVSKVFEDKVKDMAIALEKHAPASFFMYIIIQNHAYRQVVPFSFFFRFNSAAISPSILFNHLKWTSKLLELSLLKKPLPTPTNHLTSATFRSLLNSHATLFHAVTLALFTSPSFDKKSRSTQILRQATNLTRRFLARGVDICLDVALKEVEVKWCLIVGAAVDVAVRKDLEESVEKRKQEISSYFTFFQKFTTPAFLQAEILANADRLMLRSPEIIIRIYNHIFLSVSFDVTAIFKEKFADSLLTHMKSTTDSVRSDAVALFETLAGKSSDEKALEGVVDIVVKAFSAKSPTPDHRVLYYTALSVLPSVPTVSKKILTALPPLITKETIEPTLNASLHALSRHINSDTTAIAFVNKGLADPKSLARKCYLSCLEKFEGRKESFEGVVGVVDRVGKAGIALLDSKKEGAVIAEGYLGVRWVLGCLEEEKKAGGKEFATLVEKKKFPCDTSGSKNTSIGSLLALEPLLKSHRLRMALGFLLTSSLYQVRRESCERIRELVESHDAAFMRVGNVGRIGVGNVLIANGHGERVFGAIMAMTPKVMRGFGCVSDVGVEAGELVGELGGGRIEGWLGKNAGDATLGGLVGVPASPLDEDPPTIVMRSVMERVIEGIRGGEGVTAKEVEIWRGQEGVLVIDVVGKKGRVVKDEVRISVKQAAAEKKNGAGKANAAAKAEKEMERVQLEKESEIRRRVNEIRDGVLGWIDVLEAVVEGVSRAIGDEPREAMEMWIGRVVEGVLKVVARELVEGTREGVIVGKRAISLFRKLAGSVLDLRVVRFVELGWDTAMFRLMGVVEGEEGLPKEAFKKDLAVTVTKLLVSAKSEFTASNPLSPGSFALLFPLLSALILREGRAASMKEKIRTELTMVASDILIAHVGLGGSHMVPRRAMIRDLVELLTRYPRLHGAAREGLLTLCMAMEDAAASDDVSEEEMESLDVEDVIEIKEAREAMARDEQADETICTEAERVWELWNGEEAKVTDVILGNILELITYKVPEIRASAGRALCEALENLPSSVSKTFTDLQKLYHEKNVLPTPEYDEYGMVVAASLEKEDDWRSRSGIALALKACAPVIDSKATIESLFRFLMDEEALGDRSERVRSQLLDAGVAAIDSAGKDHVTFLLKLFSDCLSLPAGTSKTHDWVRESVVILLGTAARHLDPSDKLIPEVVERLVETLKTPSEAVQVAVSDCLPPLVKGMTKNVDALVQRLLRMLFDSPRYGDRRGAAYGLAGVVRGRGISSLKEFGIMSSLKDAVEDKKLAQRREGSLFAYEALSTSLGRLFEPYVIQILPLLLVCYGDVQREVREATNDACKAIMSKLSGHCVKLVMPSILRALEDKNWRTKTGAIEVMSSMAYLAPKQLSLSLPTIVPRLCPGNGQAGLDCVWSSHQNPEIQELVPTLLAALVDPNSKTLPALSALLETSFVHYIDAPSLALIVPILERGLTERATDTKKKAAQIMGQMATLTDQKDLIPYLANLLPKLKEVLVDPVPEARGVAARALGSMIEKMGEVNFPGLVSELLVILKSENSAVDRFGAAQGLSEVLAGIGVGRMEGLLPDIINNAMSIRPHVREGFMTLLVYLPTTFGETFQAHLGSIIPPILRGLADETETVRETSLKAGRVVVKNYATTAVDLLLPELETGLFDENWRIRQSSIQLMGDLLYRIAGISGRVDTETANEDETLGTENGRQALVAALGLGQVPHGACHLPARLEEYCSQHAENAQGDFAVLMKLIISSLASPSYDKRGVAARTLGELVRKLGDAVLEEIVPILEQGLESPDPDTRQGALMDSEEEVREVAAQAFDMLHQHLGPKAIDEVLPSLLNELKAGASGGASNYALERLRRLFFPVLIPTLLSKPISSFNAHHGGPYEGLEQNDSAVDDIRESLKVLLLSVEQEGLHVLMSILEECVAKAAVTALFRGPPVCDEDTVKAAWDALEALSRSLRRDLGSCEEDHTRSAQAFCDADYGTSNSYYWRQVPPGVKAAILNTLGLLLVRVPAMLKPFLPQLQRTFIKSLSESTHEIRDPAKACLNILITLQPRLDPLIVELTGGVRTSEDKGIKKAMWDALLGLLKSLGNGRDISDVSKSAVEGLVVEGVLGGGENDDIIRDAASRCFGALCKYLTRDEARAILNFHLFGKTADSSVWTRLHGMILVIKAVMRESPLLLHFISFTPNVVALIQKCLDDEKAQITEAAVQSASVFLQHEEYLADDNVPTLMAGLINLAKPGDSRVDGRRMAVKVIKKMAKHNHKLISPLLSTIVPVLMLCVRDRVIPIKLAAERALIYVFQLSVLGRVRRRLYFRNYVKGLDPPTARKHGDYARRVLTKLAEKDSADEGEDDDEL